MSYRFLVVLFYLVLNVFCLQCSVSLLDSLDQRGKDLLHAEIVRRSEYARFELQEFGTDLELQDFVLLPHSLANRYQAEAVVFRVTQVKVEAEGSVQYEPVRQGKLITIYFSKEDVASLGIQLPE